ncbi:MAG: leucine-rich repeat protein [Bacilli bacterium]|nr:leucine-rich repeat protein [Bacilli bacterium]
MFVETDDENDEIIEPNECQSVTRDFFNIHGYPTPDPDENISGVDIEVYNVEIIKRNEMQIIIIPNEIRRISDLYVSISPLNSESTKMTIIFPPSVEIIDEGVFRNQERIKEVIFAEGLKRIENNAFYGCPELKELSIPDSVAFIGENAFAECSISKLSISDENSHVEYFRNKYGTEITELTLRRNGKNGIENLEYISTLGLPLLKKIRITGTPLSDEEFDRVKNLFLDITLINGKEQEDEKSDDPLTINDETWIIYKGVLYGSRRNFGQEYRTPIKDLPYHYAIQYTHEKVVIPDGVIEIAPHALKEKYIGEIVLPNTLQIIGNFALDENQIRELQLPKSLKTIGYEALGNDLIELSIPKGITSLAKLDHVGRLVLSDIVIDTISEKRGLIKLLAEAYEIIIINDTNQYMKLYELVVEHRNYWLRKITFIGADISWRKRLQMEFASKKWKRKKIKVECISEEDKKIISVNGKDITSIDDKDINILIARINRSLNALSTQEAEIIRDMVTAMIDE